MGSSVCVCQAWLDPGWGGSHLINGHQVKSAQSSSCTDVVHVDLLETRRWDFRRAEWRGPGWRYINHDRHSVTMEALSHLNLALPTHALQPPVRSAFSISFLALVLFGMTLRVCTLCGGSVFILRGCLHLFSISA